MPGPSGFLPGVSRPASEPSQDRSYRKQKRAADFPYDKPVMYGAARGIDNMGGGFADMSQQHGAPLTPMDVSHGPWDPETGELDEVSGSPMLLGKASDTGMGGTIPGTARGWAGPTRDWDDEEAVERAGSTNESAWAALSEGLGITMGEPGVDAIGLELSSQKDDFRAAFDRTSPIADRMDPKSLVSVMIDLDPDYAAEELAPEDPSEARGMYRRWGSYVLDGEKR